MDRKLNGPTVASSSSAGGATRSSYPPLQPNYSIPAVQEALEHLASIDLIDLCKEAKIECCRATRDLRSCGRYVQHVLNSCGHASLCAECSQRCDICPICRTPIAKSDTRLRLYYECMEAGLVSKRFDERFKEKEDGEKQLTTDAQRLYSLFDVALENNLVSLICHYVTDVCMDESAVSSDPIIAFLLDEVVVKDWCNRTFKNILTELQGIYNLKVEEMESSLSLLLKFIVHVAGISNVLEVLESSFKGTHSAHLQDLHQLQESILKTKQHLEIMIWCIRHQFLENVRSRYKDSVLWDSAVRERRSAAIKRAWPDAVNPSLESTRQNVSLFIEDALANLGMEQGLTLEIGEEIEVASLLKNGVKEMADYYPFKSLQDAVDVLFLHGSSDLVIAKQAIFLYYLFDRHWTICDEEWRGIIEDFAAIFSITRHSLLESLIFYLLDDTTDDALQEACRLLPEISVSGPATHPKIAEVLLERDSPDTALMVLRWSARDGGSQMVSLGEAVTAVRVRVECGLLTEAFMHQRMLCTRVREKKLNYGPSGGATAHLKGEGSSWADWVEILVTEICCLCIRRNLVECLIALPWNSDEEKHIHTCLFDYAVEDPLRTTGSLLVVFYIQRYRYAEAFQVHLKLQTVEQDFISKNYVAEEVLTRITLTGHWRATLIDKSLELLPEVKRQQLRSGKLPEPAVPSQEEVEIPEKADLPDTQDPKSISLLIPSSANSSYLLHTDHTSGFLRPSIFETASRLGGSVYSFGSEFSNFGSSHERLVSNTERGLMPLGSIEDSFRYDSTVSPRTHQTNFMDTSPFKGKNRSSAGNPTYKIFGKLSPAVEQNGILFQNRYTSPLNSYRATANSYTRTTRNREFSKDFARDLDPNTSTKIAQPDIEVRPWIMVSPDDLMDASCSHVENGSTFEDRNTDGGPRWRSDETSDEEEEQGLERAMGIAHHVTPTRRFRRSRLSKR